MVSEDELVCVLSIVIIQREKNTKKEKTQGMVSKGLVAFLGLSITVINTFKGLVLLVGDSGKTKAFLKYLASLLFEFHVT